MAMDTTLLIVGSSLMGAWVLMSAFAPEFIAKL
jgi:hypothetical protein